MFYNIVICYNPIFGAKVRIFFHIAKFICKILQNYCFACIYQKKVVTLHAKSDKSRKSKDKSII